jgi:osmoprotectant transport system substrate-binding protein
MRRTAVILVGLLGLLGWQCGGGGDDRSIVVGSKLDTEAQLLGRLMALQLEAKGYSVRTKIPLGGTDIIRKALTSKRIDVYWEFTGSGLNLLGQRPIGDPQAAFAKVKELDAANGVTWLPAARLNDTYALAVKGDGGPIAARTLTELAATLRSQPGARLCVDPEGGFREDVLPVLQSVYAINFGDTTQLGHSLIPAAVAEGRCAVGIVYSTTALIVKHGLRILEDDKAAFGAYTPAPTVLTSRLSRWPGLADDLAGLTAALDTPTITTLNAQVDVEKLTPEQVARDFLVKRGLISGTAVDKGPNRG